MFAHKGHSNIWNFKNICKAHGSDTRQIEMCDFVTNALLTRLFQLSNSVRFQYIINLMFNKKW